MKKAKILIVENKAADFTDSQKLLKDLGYIVIGIINSEETSLDIITEKRPDIILVDIQNENDFITINTAFKISDSFPIPVIFITPPLKNFSLDNLEKAKPFAYIAKPLTEDKLTSVIETTLYRHNVEKKLIKSAETYRTIFETTGNATILIDDDMTIILANREFEKISGCDSKELNRKRRFTEFILPEDREMMTGYHLLRRKKHDAAPRNYECGFIGKNGCVKDAHVTVAVIPGTKYSVASFMDITDQKRLETEIIRISELERQKIGNNLHDGLGPHLVGIRFMMNLLKQKLKAPSKEVIKDFDEINDLINQAVGQTRRLVKGLCPAEIDPSGLVIALEDMVANAEKICNISIKLHSNSNIPVKDNTTASNLYLVASEALNNAIKHSDAKNIDITLTSNSETLTLTVHDDGIGFQKLLDSKSGMGINIMKYRARIINSSFEIQQNDKGGISVICVLKKN